MRGDADRLLDILAAISKIREYSAYGRERFLADELVQVWIAYHLQVIGEAASGLSEGAREKGAEVPWRSIVGMRNILVHQYFGLNLDHVWNAAERELDGLESVVKQILEKGEN